MQSPVTGHTKGHIVLETYTLSLPRVTLFVRKGLNKITGQRLPKQQLQFTSPGYELLPQTTAPRPPQHCAVVTAVLSRSLQGPSLFHARITAGAGRINYDISKLGQTGCRGNETSNMIKQERVKGNCQFVLSVVAVIECVHTEGDYICN
jgi:hypothetical protein